MARYDNGNNRSRFRALAVTSAMVAGLIVAPGTALATAGTGHAVKVHPVRIQIGTALTLTRSHSTANRKHTH